MADVDKLARLAKLVRYYILEMTTRVGSGHTNTSLSAVELMISLFSTKFRFDLTNPKNPTNDRIIFSKGHASPLVYALYVAYGGLNEQDLEGYRTINSPVEGHPNPRFKYADVATGSLGQGLGIGLGMALYAKRERLPYLTYVLMGDGECAEGSIWEAMETASFYKADNLVGIIDVNRLGQSGETLFGWDVDLYKKRVEAFGWQAQVVNGHDLGQLLRLWERLPTNKGKPVMVIAKTIKGKGVLQLEDRNGWHGRPLPQEDFEKAVEELGTVDKSVRGEIRQPEAANSKFQIPRLPKPGTGGQANSKFRKTKLEPPYKVGEEIATRKAYGEALAALAEINPLVVSLDADVKNSTYTESFEDKYPERFYEMFIAEQNMVSVAVGMAAMGYVPFASTFGVFLTRAFDQIRMAGYSRANVKFLGSHAGVSIGEDGPSQMALQDIAMFRTIDGSTILYPADGIAVWRMVKLAAENAGIFYIRTNRPATPVIYDQNEEFQIGGSKVVRSTKEDKMTIVSCGVTLIEAIKAADELVKRGINIRVIDAYSIKPIDEVTLRKAASETNDIIITVEDHYYDGGLGDAVLNVFANQGKVEVFKLAVSKIPMSGTTRDLLKFEGINADSLVNKVLAILG